MYIYGKLVKISNREDPYQRTPKGTVCNVAAMCVKIRMICACHIVIDNDNR